MSARDIIRCVVAYATPERQFLWPVELAPGATVADAIEAARRAANLPEVPWESAPVGIFGQPCSREHVPREGDRIELYRPLAADPRERRRAGVRRERGRGGPSGR